MISYRKLNAWLSVRIHWRLPEELTAPLFPVYDRLILDACRSLGRGVVLDVGAGFLLPVARSGLVDRRVRFVGIDILEQSLKRNPDLQQAIVADACNSWPLADESVDLVISRSVIEHLYDTEVFASESFRVLKPGGVGIHVLPGKNAPFSLLNRLLPNAWTNRMLRWALPEQAHELGYLAYYRNCAYPQVRRLFERNGFDLERIRLRYYQSSYFRVLFPVYLVSVAYDWLVWWLGARPLASQILVVVRKPEQGSGG